MPRNSSSLRPASRWLTAGDFQCVAIPRGRTVSRRASMVARAIIHFQLPSLVRAKLHLEWLTARPVTARMAVSGCAPATAGRFGYHRGRHLGMFSVDQVRRARVALDSPGTLPTIS